MTQLILLLGVEKAFLYNNNKTKSDESEIITFFSDVNYKWNAYQSQAYKFVLIITSQYALIVLLHLLVYDYIVIVIPLFLG